MKRKMKKPAVFAICIGLFLSTGILVCASSQYTGYVFFVNDNNFWVNDLSTNTSTQITHLETSIGLGTLSSPSISADGAKIVFAYKANLSTETMLYCVNSDGSGLENLSLTQSLLSQTKNQSWGIYSPDMTKLAFTAEPKTGSVVTGRQLYLKELTGLKRLFQLTLMDGDCHDVQFVDDSHIIFKYTLGYLEDYYLISTDGSDLTNLTNNNNYAPYFPRLGRPAVNQSRSSISYAKQIQDTSGYSNWEIYQLDLQTLNEILIITNMYFPEDPLHQDDPQPVILTDSWSVDTAIVFVGKKPFSTVRALYIKSFESQNPYEIEISQTTSASFPLFYPSLAKPVKFVYTSGSPEQLYLMDSSGQTVQLTSTINRNYDPVFDLTGSLIAYAGNGIWVMKANGTDAVCIDTTFTARYPAISPDGIWVAYVKSNDIYARKIDLSTSPVRLTYSPDTTKLDLSFTPSGSALLYTGLTSNGHQIFSLPITITSSNINISGEPINLTQNPGYENYQPSYSPDGKKIIFISTRAGSPAIFTMNGDGSAQQQLIILPPGLSNPSYPQFSPWLDVSNITFIANGSVNTANLETTVITPISIMPAGKFSWGKHIKNSVLIKRQLTYDRTDGNLPYYIYYLNISINPLVAPSSFIITENLPTISSGASANWKITGAWFNDTALSPLTSSGNTTGTVKWIVSNNIGSIFPLTDGILKLKIEFDGTPTEGSWNFLNGSVVYDSTINMTSGDSYIIYGQPDCPADTDGNKEISDSELLSTIDIWVSNSRIRGWPIKLDDWDFWLLKVIDFWVKDGYVYAPTLQEPSWNSI